MSAETVVRVVMPNDSVYFIATPSYLMPRLSEETFVDSILECLTIGNIAPHNDTPLVRPLELSLSPPNEEGLSAIEIPVPVLVEIQECPDVNCDTPDRSLITTEEVNGNEVTSKQKVCSPMKSVIVSRDVSSGKYSSIQQSNSTAVVRKEENMLNKTVMPATPDEALCSTKNERFSAGGAGKMLRISKLPYPFFKNHFLHFPTSALEEIGILESDILHVSDVDSKNSLTMEFFQPVVATAACKKLHNIRYENSDLAVALEGGDCNVICISNLPELFFEDHFKHFMMNCLAKKHIKESDILHVSVLDKDHSVTVESSKAVSALSTLSCATYEKNDLIVEFAFGEASLGIPPSPTQFIATIQISNLPDPFFEKHFQHFLYNCLAEKKILESDILCVSDCKDHCLTVEFFQESVAFSACAKLKGAKYERKALDVKLMVPDADLAVSKHSNAKVVHISNLPEHYFEVMMKVQMSSVTFLLHLFRM